MRRKKKPAPSVEPPPRQTRQELEQAQARKDTKPDWTHSCDNCGATPIVPVTGLCGPCTFGEAATAGGEW